MEQKNSEVMEENNSINYNSNNTKNVWYKNKVVIGVVVVVLFLIILSFAGNNDTNENDNSDSTNNSGIVDNENKVDNSNSNNNKNNKNKYSFDETFEFDNLEITIGSEYSFTKVDNKFSDYHNQDVIKIPITVKNLADETHGLNMFYYKVYGSKGTKAQTVGSYFDDDIDFAGDLRSGASHTQYIYVLYDGDGTYSIEFDNWSSKITVEFEIKKEI